MNAHMIIWSSSPLSEGNQCSLFAVFKLQALGALKTDYAPHNFILFIDITCILLICPTEREKIPCFKVRFIWELIPDCLKVLLSLKYDNNEKKCNLSRDLFIYINDYFLHFSSLWFYSKDKHRNLKPSQMNLVLIWLALSLVKKQNAGNIKNHD